MLDGDDGKTLFMLTAPSSLPTKRGAELKGKISSRSDTRDDHPGPGRIAHLNGSRQ
jgi:hypothetical protein